MNTMWLLPVVTLVVSSSSAGVLANALQEYSIMNALVTLTTGVFIVTVGFTLSFIIFTIYFQRLFVYGLPEGAAALTVFLPLGPSGQAGFSIILIGQNFNKLLPLMTPSSVFLRWPYAGQAINVLCTCIAFLLWTLASMFLFFGLLSIITTVQRTHIPFTPSFWGLIFPNVSLLHLERKFSDGKTERLCNCYYDARSIIQRFFLPSLRRRVRRGDIPTMGVHLVQIPGLRLRCRLHLSPTGHCIISNTHLRSDTSF